MHKVLLDTDPGIDDAMAIFMALGHPEIDLLGLTTTFGNVSVQQATHNALLLLEMAGADLPVAMGVARPRQREPMPFPDFVHGTDGLGDLRDPELPEPVKQAETQEAAEFIVQQIMRQPGEVNLVAVGPLGNLARALELEPAIAQQVRQVVIMGGSIGESGNVSPVAEANIFADPHAAERVFAAQWPVVMAGLDVTHQVLLKRSLFAALKAGNPRIGGFMQRAAEFYINFYQRERAADDGCFGHDISAVAYVVAPHLFTTLQGAICVVPDGLAAGQTILNRYPERSYFVQDWEGRPQQQACMQVNDQAIADLFLETLTGAYWQ